MNSSVGQLSAVAAMLQFLSDKRDKSIIPHPPVCSILKGNSGSYWASEEHYLFSCFGKQESLLTELITS